MSTSKDERNPLLCVPLNEEKATSFAKVCCQRFQSLMAGQCLFNSDFIRDHQKSYIKSLSECLVRENTKFEG